MSLINQMLGDLEHRGGCAAAGEGPLLGLSSSEGGGGGTRRRRAAYAAALSVLLGAAAVFVAHDAARPDRAAPAPTADSVATVPGAGGAEQAAADVPASPPPRLQLATMLRLPPALPREPALPAGNAAAAVPDGPDVRSSHRPDPVRATPAEDAEPPVRGQEAGRGASLPAADTRDREQDSPPRFSKQPLPVDPAAVAEQRYLEAMQWMREGRRAAGDAALARLLTEWPAHVRARSMLVISLIEQKQYDAAMRWLPEGPATSGDDRRLLKHAGRLLVAHGESRRALEMLSARAPGIDADPEYHAFIATLLQRAGRHAEAIPVYLDVLDRDPGQGVWWVGVAISLEAERRAADALDAFRRALASAGLPDGLRRYARERIARLQ